MAETDDEAARFSERNRFTGKLEEFSQRNQECYESLRESEVIRNCNPKRNSTKNWTPEGVPPEPPKDFVRKFQLFYEPLAEAIHRFMRNVEIAEMNARREVVEFNVTMFLIWHRVLLRLDRWIQRKENDNRFPHQGKALRDALNALSGVLRMCNEQVDGLTFLRFAEIEHLDEEKSNVYRRKEVAALERQTRMTAARSLGLGRRLNDDQKMLMAIRTALVLQSYKDEGLYWQLCRPWTKYVQRYEHLHKRIFPMPQELVLLSPPPSPLEDDPSDQEMESDDRSGRESPMESDADSEDVPIRDDRIGEVRAPAPRVGAQRFYPEDVQRAPGPQRFHPEAVMAPEAPLGVVRAPTAFRMAPEEWNSENIPPPEAIRLAALPPEPPRSTIFYDEPRIGDFGAGEAYHVPPPPPQPTATPRPPGRHPGDVRAPEVHAGTVRAPESFPTTSGSADVRAPDTEASGPSTLHPEDVEIAPEDDEAPEWDSEDLEAPEAFPSAPGSSESFPTTSQAPEPLAPQMVHPEDVQMAPEALEAARVYPEVITLGSPEIQILEDPTTSASGTTSQGLSDAQGWNPDAFQMPPGPSASSSVYPEVITLGSPDIEILEGPTTSGAPEADPMEVDPDEDLFTEFFGAPASEAPTTSSGAPVDPEVGQLSLTMMAPEYTVTAENLGAPEATTMISPASMMAPESSSESTTTAPEFSTSSMQEEDVPRRQSSPEVITLDSPEHEDSEDVAESPEGSPHRQEAPESPANVSAKFADSEDVPRRQEASESVDNESPNIENPEDVTTVGNAQNPPRHRQVSPEDVAMEPEVLEEPEDAQQSPETLPRHREDSPEDVISRESTQSPFGLTSSASASDEAFVKDFFVWRPPTTLNPAPDVEVLTRQDSESPPTSSRLAPEVMDTPESSETKQVTAEVSTSSNPAPEVLTSSASPDVAPEATSSFEPTPEVMDTSNFVEAAPEVLTSSEQTPEAVQESSTSTESAPEAMDTSESPESLLVVPEVSTSSFDVAGQNPAVEDVGDSESDDDEMEDEQEEDSDDHPEDVGDQQHEDVEDSESDEEEEHEEELIKDSGNNDDDDVNLGEEAKVQQPENVKDSEDVKESEDEEDSEGSESGDVVKTGSGAEDVVVQNPPQIQEGPQNPEDVRDSESSHDDPKEDVRDSEAAGNSEPNEGKPEDVEGLQNPPDAGV